MNNTVGLIKKDEPQEKFNYSFDYSEYVYTGVSGHQPSVFQPGMKAIIVTATFATMLFMIVLLLRRKSRGHHGMRWYAANLMLVNFVVLIVIVVNDRDMSFLIKQHISPSTYARFKSYNFDIVELSNIVYVSTTTFLIVDSTYRYRQNSLGFTHKQWAVIMAVNDVVPLVFVIIQKEFFPYTALKPKPYALYHFLWWSAFGAASFLFITASLCCLRKRKREEYMEREIAITDVHKSSTFSKEYENAFVSGQPLVFNHRHLLRLSLFLLATMWIQGPTAYNLPADLIPVEKVDPTIAMKLMPKVQPYIKMLIDINIWCTILMPLLETLACLVFLPSFGDLFCFSSESTFHHTATSPVF